MKIFIKDIINNLEKLAPIEYAESYDNVGLIVGSPHEEVENILVTLDLIDDVFQEAIQKKCNLIISFHPIIFKAIKNIVNNNYWKKIIIYAIKKNIAIYVIHTNLDSVWNGTSSYITNLLKIKRKKVLIPKKGILKKLYTYVPIKESEKIRNALFQAGAGDISDYSRCSYNIEGWGSYMGNEKTNPTYGKKNIFHIEKEICISVIFPFFKLKNIKNALFKNHPYEEIAYEIHNLENINHRIGIGIVGNLYKKMDEYSFLSFLKKKLNLVYIRHSKFRKKNVQIVSMITGSGRFGIEYAIKEKSDVFITSDLKYHDFFQSLEKMLIIDIGHYESEKFIKKMLKSFLEKLFPSIFVYDSQIDTNSIKYFS